MIICWDGNRYPKMSFVVMEICDDDTGMQIGDGDVVGASMEIGMTIWLG